MQPLSFKTSFKTWAFAIGLLTTGFVAAATSAQADYAVVQFGDGSCRIWWDSAGNPWGDRWTKIAIGLPDHETAQVALDSAFAQRICH
jgi:hypothetical protein